MDVCAEGPLRAYGPTMRPHRGRRAAASVRVRVSRRHAATALRARARHTSKVGPSGCVWIAHASLERKDRTVAKVSSMCPAGSAARLPGSDQRRDCSSPPIDLSHGSRRGALPGVEGFARLTCSGCSFGAWCGGLVESAIGVEKPERHGQRHLQSNVRSSRLSQRGVNIAPRFPSFPICIIGNTGSGIVTFE